MTAAIAEEFGRIPMSPFLKATLARAADYASAQMHREVTLEHLLLALAEDPEASIVLKSSEIDIQRLMSDVSGYLGRIDDRVDGTATPAAAISNDLRRILEASAAAASQGRRREINGAIVLAAIVGDGKSPAAHMLRSQGLTFEQAIRALQQAAAAPTGKSAPPAPRAGSADDIMASARERVLTRNTPPEPQIERTQLPASPRNPEQAPARPSPGPPPPNRPPAAEGNTRDNAPASFDATTAPLDPVASGMGQASMRLEPGVQSGAPSMAPPVIPPPNPAGFPQGAQPNRTPAPSPQNAPIAQPVQASPAGPPRQNPFAAQNGSRSPQGGLAPWPSSQPPPNAAGGGQQSGPPQHQSSRPPGAPQPAPWADQGLQPGQRGGHYDEAMARLDARRPQPPGSNMGPNMGPGATPAQQRRPANATTVQTGQLVENIPRKMRVGIPVIVEARVARADVKAIADGLQGDGAVYRHEVTVTKAMSVRLRAPDGGFTIETASPETQWIENVLGLMSNDYASWRWSVSPRARGKRKLQLVISARTVGTDGLTAETALPDQVIDVAVGINYARTLATWGTWIGAAVIGGLLSRFGDTLFEFGKVLWRSSV